MTNSFRALRLRQIDQSLATWSSATLPPRPGSGWVRAIRNALGMGSAALAKRVGVTDSAVRKFEEAEAADAITLGSLRKLGQALDCELHYALVPRKPLAQMRGERAQEVARRQVQAVARTMALEDQSAGQTLAEEQAHEIAQALLAKSGRGLW